ncbi:MAG: IS200/IS605 family transposase [Planctomycetales bacterium]|nr:IS200/IS605 family transposase [Planctomycetales bacterium]
MSTYTKLLFHVVFATKYRKRTISPQWEQDLYAYISALTREKNGRLLASGGTQDHAHFLFLLPPTMAISDFLRVAKACSSKWINERPDVHFRFAWQTGFSAFSVSDAVVPNVQKYIQNQKEHHLRESSQEELIRMLKLAGIEFVPRFVVEQEPE